MTPIRIVFMGSPEFAVPSLEALAATGHTVAAVVTGPDKKRGRGGALSPTPVKAAALRLGLPVIETETTRSPAFLDQIRALNPDLLVVVAFRILPPPLLAVPRLGSINLHASLLPRYRGAAPIHWAVIQGDTETGNTVFLLNEQVDAGGILARRSTPIGPDETTGDVYNRLMLEGAPLVVEAVHALADGTARPAPQDNALATPAPKVFADMARISFDVPANVVHNRIRGFTPAPGAWALAGGERVKLFGSRVADAAPLAPGEAGIAGGEFRIGCANGTVSLHEIQFPGRPRVDALAYLKASRQELRFEN